MKYESIENELLYRICYYSCLPDLHEWIFNSKTLMYLRSESWDELKISWYRTKKFIHSWEGRGMIEKHCVGGVDEDGYVHCSKGYRITGKMERTEIYKRASKDVNNWITEWMNEPIKED